MALSGLPISQSGVSAKQTKQQETQREDRGEGRKECTGEQKRLGGCAEEPSGHSSESAIVFSGQMTEISLGKGRGERKRDEKGEEKGEEDVRLG